MDLYSNWDPTMASGASTPVKDTSESFKKAEGADNTIASSSTAEATSHASASGTTAASKAKPTLEQEIEQMGTLVSGMGKNLGSYWSSFRRQSEAAIKQSQALASNAAKDLTPYLDKAKAELDRLNEQAKASAAAGQAASISEMGVNVDNPSVVLPAPKPDKGKGVDREGNPASPTGSVKTLVPDRSEDSGATMNATAFFSKLQTQLSTNPNFKNFQNTFHTMQHDLKEKVVDFNKIDIHEAKERYEKAMNSSEKYWKVASKELSDLFGEVVSIVPPEGYNGQDAAGQRTGAAAGKAADKRRKDAAVAAAGRKEMLLHRIRSEPAILLVDPALPPEALPGSADPSGEDKRELHSDSREAFATFLQGIESAGGIASADWKEKVNAELDDEEGGLALKQTFDSIVPNKIPEEAFWTRYFFRLQQIEEDEARRREILEGAAQQEDDDFSWDMEDESASSAAPEDEQEDASSRPLAGDSASTPKLGGPVKAAKSDTSATNSDDVDASWGSPPEQASPAGSPTTTSVVSSSMAQPTKSSSPRNSSEEGTNSSYDVVSAGDASSPMIEKQQGKKQAEDDSDSDWE